MMKQEVFGALEAPSLGLMRTGAVLRVITDFLKTGADLLIHAVHMFARCKSMGKGGWEDNIYRPQEIRI